jgi:hypothetical protein
MDLATELLKAWGPAGLVAVVLWIMLKKSEEREEKKDLRIQMLENLVIESYGERIEAADNIATALTSNSNALTALTHEIRANRHV